MSEQKNSVFSPAKAIQALYNQEATCDVALDVNGHAFYGHTTVLVPACRYLEQTLQWPQTEFDGSQQSTTNVARICLPSILAPEFLSSGQTWCDTQFWFDRFLKVIYGLYDLDGKNVVELLIMVQIADYMLCESMLSECDDALSASLDKEHVLDLALFCQKYPLPKTFNAVQNVIAGQLPHHCLDSKLYAIDKEHFQQILQSPSCKTRKAQFFVTYRYVTGQNNCAIDNLSPVPGFKDTEMRALFQDLVIESCSHWDKDDLSHIDKFFKNCETILNGNLEDQLFLLKTLNQCYKRLYCPSG